MAQPATAVTTVSITAEGLSPHVKMPCWLRVDDNAELSDHHHRELTELCPITRWLQDLPRNLAWSARRTAAKLWRVFGADGRLQPRIASHAGHGVGQSAR